MEGNQFVVVKFNQDVETDEADVHAHNKYK